MREFSRKKAHRDHLLRNLATSLVLYERIDTTLAKAKEVKGVVDKLIARALKNDLNAIKMLNGVFFDRNATKKMIEELVPRYKNRKSGFIRSYHLKNRPGDNSEMIRLELVDHKVFVEKMPQLPKPDEKTKKEKDGTK